MPKYLFSTDTEFLLMHLTIIKIIKGEIYDWFLNGGAEFCVAQVVV